MMVSQGITLLDHTAMFKKYIREWRRKTTELKTWANYKMFFHQSHRDQRIVVTTTGKGGYTATINKICSVPPPPTEEHHEVIHHINTIC